MMNYTQVRPMMKSGDTVACKVRKWGSIIIRIFTAESTNHTAMIFVAEDGGVWIYEMLEGKGLVITPASQWFAEQHARGVETTYCRAPKTVKPELAKEFLLSLRAEDPSYGYWSLIKVWFSQVFNKMVRTRQYVCSTAAQRMHEYAGYTGYTRLADPGDIVSHATGTIPVR